MRRGSSSLGKQEVRMHQLAVFPSDAVARWIDTEWFERERDSIRDQAHAPNMASRSTDAESASRRSPSPLPRLRYRPFEQLLAVRSERAA
jgi:hypothetical protein